MRLGLVLAASAAYMAFIGIGMLVVPAAMSFGLVDAGTDPALLMMLRLPASAHLGIALLNWLARDAGPSQARDTILLANGVGFGLGGLLMIWAALGGWPVAVWGLVIVNLLFSAAFFSLRRAEVPAGA